MFAGGICIRYLWRGLKKTCLFPGRYQLANFSHMALSCLHKITQTSLTFFLQQNSSSASFPKFPHHLLTTTKFVFFSFFFIFIFLLSVFLCVSQSPVALLFFMCIISRRTEDPRDSNRNGEREREKSECGTRQQNLRTSRVER